MATGHPPEVTHRLHCAPDSRQRTEYMHAHHQTPHSPHYRLLSTALSAVCRRTKLECASYFLFVLLLQLQESWVNLGSGVVHLIHQVVVVVEICGLRSISR